MPTGCREEHEMETLCWACWSLLESGAQYSCELCTMASSNVLLIHSDTHHLVIVPSQCDARM